MIDYNKRRKIFEAILGNFICNINEITEDVWNKDDWSLVEMWEPYEHWGLVELKNHIQSIYEDVISVDKEEAPEIPIDILEWWNSLPIQSIEDSLGWGTLTERFYPEKEDCYNLTEEEIKFIYNKLYN